MRKILGVHGWWLPMTSVVLIFGAHWSYGANTNALALVFSLFAFFLCLAGLVFMQQSSWILAEPDAQWAGLFFMFTLIYVGMQLTPFLPGGSHPFWAWSTTGAGITLDRDATFRELSKLGALAAVFILGLLTGSNDRRAEIFFRMMNLIGVIFALWAFFVYITDASVAIEGRVQTAFRLKASFLSANSAAMVFGIMAILAMATFIRSVKEIAYKRSNSEQFLEQFITRSPLALIALLLSLIALLLTASRGGISASLIALLVFIGWELSTSKNRTGNAKTAIGVLVIAFALFVFVFMISGDLFFDRLAGAQWIEASRNVIFAAHWQAILASPWTGYGMGSFYLVNDTLMNVQNWRALHNIGAIHNVYLQWLEEGGIIGAVLMWGTLVFIFWSIFASLKRRRRMRTWIRAVLCISLLVLIHGMVEYGLQVPSISISWAMLLGVGLGLGTIRPS